jgi:hypothetical protein
LEAGRDVGLEINAEKTKYMNRVLGRIFEPKGGMEKTA